MKSFSVSCRNGFVACAALLLNLASIMPGYADEKPLSPSHESEPQYRDGEAMVAAAQTSPALFIGGVEPGDRGATDSSAVEAVWPDGTWRSLGRLPSPLRDASAFRLADGSIVVMTKTSGEILRIDEQRLFNNGEWIRLGVVGTDFVGVGQCANGDLLLLASRGNMMRLAFIHEINAEPAFNKSSLPNLNRPRADAVIRGLSDGRVIVAGGAVQPEKIALMTADSNRADAQDNYVSVGEYLPARRYEIFDPASGTWRNSAPSRSAGGSEVILDDGSVVKLGLITVKNAGAAKDKSAYREKEETILERSRPDGSGWSSLGALKPPSVVLSSAKLLAVDGELYLSGLQLTESSRIYSHGNHLLQWFNGATRSWETLWESDPNETGNFRGGRILTLTLANEKKLVLPVEPR